MDYFIDLYKDKLNWSQKSLYENIIDHKFIHKYIKYINWDLASKFFKINKKNLKKYKENLNWAIICEEENLVEADIIEFQDDVIWDILFNCDINYNWNFILKHIRPKFSFLIKIHLKNLEFRNINNYSLDFIYDYQINNDKLIEQIRDSLSFDYICDYQKMR